MTLEQNKILLDSNLQLNAYQLSNGSAIIGEKYYNQIQSEPSSSSVIFGSAYIKLKIERNSNHDFLNDARIVFGISAMSQTAGTYIRGVNALGIFTWDWIRLFSGGKQKAEISSQMAFENLYKKVNDELWGRIANDIGYNTSTTARNTLAASPQLFSIPLKHLFNLFSKPINLNNMEDLELRIYLKNNISYTVQQDGTVPVYTFQYFYLDCEYVQPYTPEIMNLTNKMISSGKPPIWYEFEYLEKDFTLSSGSNTAVLDLQELADKNVVDICCFMAPSTNYNTPSISDYTDSNLAISTYNLKSGNLYLTNMQSDVTITPYFYRVILARYHLLGISQFLARTNPGFIINFFNNYRNQDIEILQHFHGYKSFVGIRDAKINITYPTLGANATCKILVRFSRIAINNYGSLQNV